MDQLLLFPKGRVAEEAQYGGAEDEYHVHRLAGVLKRRNRPRSYQVHQEYDEQQERNDDS